MERHELSAGVIDQISRAIFSNAEEVTIRYDGGQYTCKIKRSSSNGCRYLMIETII